MGRLDRSWMGDGHMNPRHTLPAPPEGQRFEGAGRASPSCPCWICPVFPQGDSWEMLRRELGAEPTGAGLEVRPALGRPLLVLVLHLSSLPW